MTISAGVRQAVRRRAGYACEYCGVSETEVGGELTIDHFRPRAHGGTDDAHNLLYACHRYNQYKARYWPIKADDPTLWNPRHDPRLAHMIELPDGTLSPLTTTGAFTVRRLRLNRPPLVLHRRRKHEQSEVRRLIERYREAAALLEQLRRYQVGLLEEQRLLLDEQRALLHLLLGKAEPPAS